MPKTLVPIPTRTDLAVAGPICYIRYMKRPELLLTEQEASTLALLLYWRRAQVVERMDLEGFGSSRAHCEQIVDGLWRQLDDFGRAIGQSVSVCGELAVSTTK